MSLDEKLIGGLFVLFGIPIIATAIYMGIMCLIIFIITDWEEEERITELLLMKSDEEEE